MGFIQRYVGEVEEEGEKEDAEEVYAILRGKLLKTAGEVTLDTDPSGAAVRALAFTAFSAAPPPGTSPCAPPSAGSRSDAPSSPPAAPYPRHPCPRYRNRRP